MSKARAPVSNALLERAFDTDVQGHLTPLWGGSTGAAP